MQHNETVTFAGGTLDRAAHLRKDVSGLLTRDDARAMVLWHGKALMDVDGPKLAWVTLDTSLLREAVEPPIFLGLHDGSPRFAFDISPWAEPNAEPGFLDESRKAYPDLPENLQFVEIRAVMSDLSHGDAGDCATAKGIFEWHQIHRFCANCGSPSDVVEAGWQRNCPQCERPHFPRTDPVVIMLVTHGNRTLLGRAAVWPEGMYSCLAGYMEPGEGIEEAVRREVFEETGVKIGRVDYLSSQPWPFPASLMIGCRAEALSIDITLDPIELENAIWVSKEDVADAMLGNNPDFKPGRQGAIARFLLDNWLSGRW